MSDVKVLVEKLERGGRAALERAAALCHARGQVTVELEHLLMELLAADDGPPARLLRALDVEPARVRAELQRAIDGFESGPARTPALSVHLVDALKEAWSRAALDGADRVSEATLVRAMLRAETPRRLILAAAPVLALISRDRLDEEVARFSGETPREAAAPEDDELARYVLDLTEEARAGRLDPVVGRDAEIRQLVDILLRRRQNNPILTGDAGVGKTAVVEGLAQLIVDGRVPRELSGVRLLALDLGLLQSGAGVRGEFERRLRAVVDGVAASPAPVVLFIDEAHVLIGSGAAPGQGDAANLLKPALARGALRCIAATTWAEYKRHIEKDPALARRFEVVKIAEPEPEVAVAMLRGTAEKLERHHGVRILEAGLREAVRLSHRYISGRQLPDKAIGVLDTACAKVAVSQSEAPAELSDVRGRLVTIDAELARLARDAPLGGVCEAERASELEAERETLVERAGALEARWQHERETVERLLARDPGAADPSELRYLQLKLETLQEAGGLVHPFVDARAVAGIVSAWTGIPTGDMLRAGVEDAQGLFDRLSERVVAQDGALATISRRIQTWFAQLGEPGKPTGVFLLAGPSGVGKTETAVTLAETLFGGRRALVTINMSEYQEAHSVSGLKGAPPGYVGYGHGGVLTEAVRRRPYSVVLLDEIEKAHRDVIELFYQVFDKGMMEDSEGVQVDFRNTVMILTSNVGAEIVAAEAARGVTEPAALAAAIRPELRRHFPAAFLGRLTVAPYLPLGRAELARIAAMKLEALRDRLAATHRAALTWERAVLDALVDRATETESGARNVDAIISDTLTPQVAGLMLSRIAEGSAIESLHVALSPEGGFSVEAR